MAMTAKITSKGQVTIPRKIREKLDSEIIEFDIVQNHIVIRAVKSVAGSLKPHAKMGSVSYKEAKEKAWDEAVQERYGKKVNRR